MKKSIKSFAQVYSGATPSSKHPEYYNGSIVWFTPKDLSDQQTKYVSEGERKITDKGFKSCSTKIIKPYSLLMSSRAPIGLLAINTVECCTNQGFKSIEVDNTQCDIEYLYYYMSFHIKEIESLGSGTTFKEVSKEAIENYKVELPDLPIQKKLVSVLKNIDHKISLNNSICTDLEAMAKQIYDYWFVQFDFPDENGKPYKSSGGKMVWNQELNREIPEGWEVGNIINNPLTSVIKTGVAMFNSKNYLPTANVVNEIISDGEYVTFDNRESRANMQPSLWSIWFAKMKNSIKHISIPDNGSWFVDKYILSTGFEGIQCDEKSFGYIHCIINSTYFETYKDKVAHGATQESVNDDDLKCIKFVIPSDDVLIKFANTVNPLLKQKFSCIQENQQLTELRDFLLPMLMNGQIKIDWGVKR